MGQCPPAATTPRSASRSPPPSPLLRPPGCLWTAPATTVQTCFGSPARPLCKRGSAMQHERGMHGVAWWVSTRQLRLQASVRSDRLQARCKRESVFMSAPWRRKAGALPLLSRVIVRPWNAIAAWKCRTGEGREANGAWSDSAAGRAESNGKNSSPRHCQQTVIGPVIRVRHTACRPHLAASGLPHRCPGDVNPTTTVGHLCASQSDTTRSSSTCTGRHAVKRKVFNAVLLTIICWLCQCARRCPTRSQ